MAEVPRRIEQNGVPTALLWHPLLGSDFEDRLVRAIGFVIRKSTLRDAYSSFFWIEYRLGLPDRPIAQ